MSLSLFKKFFTPAFVAGVTVGALSVGAADLMGSAVFSDVQPGSYYDAAVGRMNSAGIIKGTDGKFRPGDFVTRAEVAVMLDRALNGADAPSGGGATSSRARRSSSSSSSSDAAVTEAGQFHFTVSTFNISEGAQKASVSIIRSGGKKGAVSVAYNVTEGTASASTDFTVSSGVLQFADGESTKVMTVALKNDAVGEANETFNIALSSPTGGASLGSPSSTLVTILDDDGGASAASSSSSVAAAGSNTSAAGGAISFNAASYAVNENAGSLTVTVKRTGNIGQSVAVNYATSNGTAASGTHYAQTSGTLNFGANESSKTFPVSITDNAAIEGNKSLNLTLSSPTNGAVLETPGTATLTIWDDDAGVSSGTGTLQFTASSYTVLESVGTAFVTVSRLGSNEGTTSVNFGTGDASAVANADYKPVTTTLTFLPGEMSKAVGIPIIKDTSSESEESLNVVISSITGAGKLGDITTAQLKIAGN